MDVAVHFEKVVAHFPRYHKYTLGSDLRQKSREVVTLIVRVNNTYERKVLDELHTTINSYWGHFKLASSYKLKQSLWKRFAFLSIYFQWQTSPSGSVKFNILQYIFSISFMVPQLTFKSLAPFDMSNKPHKLIVSRSKLWI
jgi:hypothetical protein